jgi:membrane protease YdiL (CAAX protease family)
MNFTNVKRYNQTFLFYGLSTIIPWTLWFLAAYVSHNFDQDSQKLSSIIAFLGLLAPFIIALFLILPSKELKQDFFSRFLNLRSIKLRYILAACLLMLASILAAQLVSTLFGYSFDQFRITGSFTFTSGVFAVWFLLIFAPVIEELAWHSYGTDCLRTRFNLFTTSMIFGLFWGLWHLPLSFIKGYYHSNLVESGLIYSVNFIVSLFPFVIIMNWLYYKAHRNILIPIIFHITAGYFNEIFATHPMSKVIQTALLLIFSAFIILNDKDFFFNQKNKM